MQRHASRAAALIYCASLCLPLYSQPTGCPAGAPPSITLNTPAPGASTISGRACIVEPNKHKVVIYALTNQWYVQPLTAAPFTNIAPDGSWTSSTAPWSSLAVLLVDPSNYTPSTDINNPALDPRVLAYTIYPTGPVSLSFSGRTWGIKMTGNAPGNQFEPGNNFWSNDARVVHVAPDGLHLKNVQVNGNWQSAEVYLTQSLGFGTYTVQIASSLDRLDRNTVAAPLFIYAGPNSEVDNEYSGAGGLVPAPATAQFVVQPFTAIGNRLTYLQPATSQFTSQMEMAADHITFRTWNGWSATPAAADIIREWTYTGPNRPLAGSERVRASLWLWNGAAPTSGTGDELILKSFTFSPAAPFIRPGGIVPVYSTLNTIQSGEWVSIYGDPLGTSSATWNGDFPVSLAGTSVKIGGKPAYLSFVSASQINLQVPDGLSPGPVTVEVTTPGGTANATATVAAVAPALFLLDDKHVAGIILRKDKSGAYGDGSYDILGTNGTTVGYKTVAARAGDTVAIFGTGFGPTDPPVPAGQPFVGAATLTNKATLQIGSATVEYSFAGLSGAGVDQINFEMPTLSRSGDFPIVVTVAGAQTQTVAAIPYQ